MRKIVQSYNNFLKLQNIFTFFFVKNYKDKHKSKHKQALFERTKYLYKKHKKTPPKRCPSYSISCRIAVREYH